MDILLFLLIWYFSSLDTEFRNFRKKWSWWKACQESLQKTSSTPELLLISSEKHGPKHGHYLHLRDQTLSPVSPKHQLWPPSQWEVESSRSGANTWAVQHSITRCQQHMEFHPFLFTSTSSFTQTCYSRSVPTGHLLPWYNCNGWLGMKHQVTRAPSLRRVMVTITTAITVPNCCADTVRLAYMYPQPS